MFDKKVVRRRRAALAISVVLSVVLLTAYFGESGDGVFHSIQRGAQEVFAPVETGAGRALKPARDAVGWFGDTFEAKGENERLRREVETLRERLGQNATAVEDAQQLKGIVGVSREEGFPQGTDPLGARVIARSGSVWYSSVKIDKGSSDGIQEDQPVIAAGGLAGKVTSVTGGTSEVTLIADGSSAVSAQVQPGGATGIVKPEVGDPEDLLLDLVEGNRPARRGAVVVTSGFASDRVRSLFPRGIPIGRVSRVDLSEVELYQRVHIEPFADLRRLDYVQVLRNRGTATQTAAEGTP